MPSDFAFKAANGLHKGLLRLTGGRFGSNLLGMPVLELTTIGRKSGQPRSVMLTSPMTDGDAIVVVASAGGNDDNPAWLLNVRANPDVEVALKGKSKQKMKAHIATADERARLWPQITSKYKNYGQYQTKTQREIPLVLLTPA